MKQLLRRTWQPILIGTVLHQGIHSMPIMTSVVYRIGDPLSVEPLSRGCLYLVLLLVANFFTGFVHTFLRERRSDVGMAVCFLDGGTIGVLSTLTSRLLAIAEKGTILDLLMPPSGGADPVLWIWKIGMSFIIMAIFCFMGLVSGGVGGGLGGLIARWTANLAARGSSPPV